MQPIEHTSTRTKRFTVGTISTDGAMPASISADAFRPPLGKAPTAPLIDGNGNYVPAGFDDLNTTLNSYHLGVDWNGDGGGNTDLGDTVNGVANGTVVEVVSDQGSATTGFGNHVVLRHDLPAPGAIWGPCVALWPMFPGKYPKPERAVTCGPWPGSYREWQLLLLMVAKRLRRVRSMALWCWPRVQEGLTAKPLSTKQNLPLGVHPARSEQFG